MILCLRSNTGSFNKIQRQLIKSKQGKEWLVNNIPAFFRAEDWTSGSPDLNLFDYELWDILGQNVCQNRHLNLQSLKQSIIEEVAKISAEMIYKSIAK